MSEQKIIQHMIDFIEEKERAMQTDFMRSGSKAKTDIVKMILGELESEMKNEDSED